MIQQEDSFCAKPHSAHNTFPQVRSERRQLGGIPMDASQIRQITRAAPVWVWDGNWWPAVVADAERGGFLIVRLENGVTVPAQKASLQLRDPALHGADKPRGPCG
jgi:hypothetical protein